MSLIIFLPLIAIMYFLMIRPQQQRVRQQREMLAQLDIGDDVVTEAGIYGTVSDLDGDTVFLMIADGVEIKVSKASIGSIIEYEDVVEDADPDA